MRQEYPRAVAILDLTAPNVTMASWRDVYRDQLRAEAANAVNFTNALAFTDRLDSYVFTVEMRLDGELKASWMGKGPDIRTDEFTIDRGCIVGKQVRLWTSPPAWYSEFVQQPSVTDGTTHWDGRLELTLFVSRNTAQGLEQESCINRASQISRRTSETSRGQFFPPCSRIVLRNQPSVLRRRWRLREHSVHHPGPL